MLCFTRRAGQKLRIGDDIVLSVQRIRGGSVRLGFLVPPDLPVDREEVADVKKRERIALNMNLAAQRLPVKNSQPPPKPAAGRKSKSKVRAAPRKVARKKSSDHPAGT